VARPTRASEFPNDNPKVSEGAIWVCPEVRSRARSWLQPAFDHGVDPRLLTIENASLPGLLPVTARPAPPPAVAPVAAPALVIPTPKPPRAATPVIETTKTAPEQAAPASDSFAEFVQALVDLAQAHGGTRAALCLPALLGAAPFRAGALGAEIEKTLAERGVLAPSGRKKSDSFEQTSSAWRSVLSGATDDLSSCGTTTLDQFGAELLAALLEVPKSRVEELRRELRRRGVAAFGMIAHAA
jgi:hypothetical protein